MWFDPRAALAAIEAAPPAASPRPGNSQDSQDSQGVPPQGRETAPAHLRMAPDSQDSRDSQAPTGEKGTPAPMQARPDSQDSQDSQRTPDTPEADARAYLAHLTQHGPATVGAAGAALGWGATRAWQAEARLRAAGLVVYGDGKAAAVERQREEE